MGDAEKLEACYRQMYRGMIDKDCELLSKVLDDSFVLAHMTGMRQNKAAFIRAVENGTLNYFSANHEHIATEIYGNDAELIGQSIVLAAVFGGGKHLWCSQLKLKLLRHDNEWKITEAQASTY